MACKETIDSTAAYYVFVQIEYICLAFSNNCWQPFLLLRGHCFDHKTISMKWRPDKGRLAGSSNSVFSSSPSKAAMVYHVPVGPQRQDMPCHLVV